MLSSVREGRRHGHFNCQHGDGYAGHGNYDAQQYPFTPTAFRRVQFHIHQQRCQHLEVARSASITSPHSSLLL